MMISAQLGGRNENGGRSHAATVGFPVGDRVRTAAAAGTELMHVRGLGRSWVTP
jgi:hypothetical protein